jgi:hypothetical protein
MTRSLTTLCSLGLVLLVAAAPSTATAGTYKVAGCHLGNSIIGLDGWSAASDDVAATRSVAWCGTKAYFGGAVEHRANPPGATAQWTFTAPQGTEISGYSLFRTARSNGGPGWTKGYLLYHDARTNSVNDAVDSCLAYRGCTARGDNSNWYAPANRVNFPNVHIKRIIAAAQCLSSSGCPAESSRTIAGFAIYASFIALRDPHRPALSTEPQGGLFFDGARLQGNAVTSWSAVDQGGGLARVKLLVDGANRASVAADPSYTDCVAIGPSTVPCPLAANGSFSFNTAALPDGAHDVRLVVADIAGNETSSRTVRVFTANHPTPNGDNPTSSAKLTARFSKGGTTTTLPYGRRRKVVGRLTTSAGAPISNARIDVYRQISRTGEQKRLVLRPTTDKDGRFSFTPAKGPSRRFTLAYRAFDTDAKPSASKTLAQRVKAGVSFRISPRTVHNGHSMHVSGRLLGGPGRNGALVTIQVLNPRKVTFLALKGDTNGRFSGNYRFRRIDRPYTFRFRAVVPRQPAYPYLANTSRTIRVRTLP